MNQGKTLQRKTCWSNWPKICYSALLTRFCSLRVFFFFVSARCIRWISKNFPIIPKHTVTLHCEWQSMLKQKQKQKYKMFKRMNRWFSFFVYFFSSSLSQFLWKFCVNIIHCLFQEIIHTYISVFSVNVIGFWWAKSIAVWIVHAKVKRNIFQLSTWMNWKCIYLSSAI